MRWLAGVLALLTASACAAPPVRLATGAGVVRAADRETAERVALALEVASAVRRRLGSARTDPPIVWAVDRSQEEERGALAICYETHIELTRDAMSSVDLYLAHELAHWYIPDSPFEKLPYFLQEGLADFVSLELFDLLAARDREHRELGTLRVPPSLLYAGYDRVRSRPDEEQEALFRIGYEAVRRLGLDRLRELVESRALPFDYLEAAGLEPEPVESEGAATEG